MQGKVNEDNLDLTGDLQEQALHDQTTAKLEDALEKERDGRKEERFIWILVTTILLNVCFFMSMQSFTGPLIIGLLQLVGFVLVAKKLGMEEVVQLFDRMLSTIANSVRGGE